MHWSNAGSLNPRDFTCGYCDREVATAVGFFESDMPQRRIYICPRCGGPNIFRGDNQIPAPRPGASVEHCPTAVAGLYNEARNSVSAGAYTGAVLCCRKLLMNIAVALGADEGKKFIDYVEFVSNEGYVPPQGRHWVDHIRKKGNEATHEIPNMTKGDATELITFLEMLLKFNYEFPNRIPKPHDIGE